MQGSGPSPVCWRIRERLTADLTARVTKCTSCPPAMKPMMAAKVEVAALKKCKLQEASAVDASNECAADQ